MKLLFLALVAVGVVSATPYYPKIQKRNGTFGSPCAQVAASSAAAMRENVFGMITAAVSHATLMIVEQRSQQSLRSWHMIASLRSPSINRKLRI